jgi:hypothetical protein
MPNSSRTAQREQRPPYGGWVLGVELLLAVLSGLRLFHGGRGYFEELFAFVVLAGAILGAIREFRRLF